MVARYAPALLAPLYEDANGADVACLMYGALQRRAWQLLLETVNAGGVPALEALDPRTAIPHDLLLLPPGLTFKALSAIGRPGREPVLRAWAQLERDWPAMVAQVRDAWLGFASHFEPRLPSPSPLCPPPPRAPVLSALQQQQQQRAAEEREALRLRLERAEAHRAGSEQRFEAQLARAEELAERRARQRAEPLELELARARDQLELLQTQNRALRRQQSLERAAHQIGVGLPLQPTIQTSGT